MTHDFREEARSACNEFLHIARGLIAATRDLTDKAIQLGSSEKAANTKEFEQMAEIVSGMVRLFAAAAMGCADNRNAYEKAKAQLDSYEKADKMDATPPTKEVESFVNGIFDNLKKKGPDEANKPA